MIGNLFFEQLENISSLSTAKSRIIKPLKDTGLALAAAFLLLTMNISKAGAQGYNGTIKKDTIGTLIQTRDLDEDGTDLPSGEEYDLDGPLPPTVNDTIPNVAEIDTITIVTNNNEEEGGACKPNILTSAQAARFYHKYKEGQEGEEDSIEFREEYCPTAIIFATPDALSQAGANMGARIATIINSINAFDNQSYIDHNYEFTALNGTIAIDVSTLTMSETNSMDDNSVWFPGISQSELLYNLTIYQDDNGFTGGLGICLMASTESGSPETANLIEGGNLTGTPGAVIISKLTPGGGIDALRFIHGYHCHIRGATHPDNPGDTAHAPVSAGNFAVASPVSVTRKGGDGTYDGTVDAVNASGSTDIETCAPLALDILSFDGEPRNGHSYLYLNTINDGNTERVDVLRNVGNGIRRSLDYASQDVSNQGAGNLGLTFIDRSPILGQPNLYQLRIVDKDGSVKYSQITSVNHETKDNSKEDLAGKNSDYFVYPNPTPGLVSIDLKNNDGGYSSGQLMDANGTVLKKISIRENEYQGTLDLSSLPDGIYFLGLLGRDGNRNYKKIIIQ